MYVVSACRVFFLMLFTYNQSFLGKTNFLIFHPTKIVHHSLESSRFITHFFRTCSWYLMSSFIFINVINGCSKRCRLFCCHLGTKNYHQRGIEVTTATERLANDAKNVLTNYLMTRNIKCLNVLQTCTFCVSIISSEVRK